MHDPLVEEEIIVGGHFILRSGRHAQWYIKKNRILDNPVWINNIARAFIDEFIIHFNMDVDVIVGPESGGARLAREVAQEMAGTPSVGLLKKEGDYEFFVQPDDIITVKGKNVIIIDDIVSTGGSFQGSIKAVQEARGNVLAAFAMTRRSSEPINLGEGIIFAALETYELLDWDKGSCPSCAMGLAITPKP